LRPGCTTSSRSRQSRRSRTLVACSCAWRPSRRGGRLGSFLFELTRDDDVDDQTKGAVKEIARDEVFLLVVEDYLWRTQVLH
jgi:hypothetical protein